MISKIIFSVFAVFILLVFSGCISSSNISPISNSDSEVVESLNNVDFNAFDITGVKVLENKETDNVYDNNLDALAYENNNLPNLGGSQKVSKETSVIVGDINYVFGRVTLSSNYYEDLGVIKKIVNGDVRGFHLRFTNIGELPVDVSQPVGFVLKNFEEKIVAKKPGLTIDEKNFVGIGLYSVDVLFVNDQPPGIYYFVLEFYGVNGDVVATLEKELEFGIEDKDIFDGVYPVLEFSSVSDLNVENIVYSIDSVILTEDKEEIETISLRVENQSQNPEDVAVYVKLLAVNNKGELANLSTKPFFVSENNLIGAISKEFSGEMFYEFKNKPYDLILLFYQPNSNNPVGSIKREILFDENADLIQ